MSRGTSPSTRRCQPVSRRSQAGSTSVVRYQLALKRRRGRALSHPCHVHPLRADRPGLDPAGGDLHRVTGNRNLSGRNHLVQRQAQGVGDDTERPPERRAPCSSTPRGSNVEGSRPKPMRSKIISGEFRDDMSANSSIVRRSSRRWTEVSTRGTASVMNPGLDPVLWRRGAPVPACRIDPLPDLRIQAGRSVELAPGRDDVRPGLQQPAEHVDVGPVRHVEDAVGLQREDVLEVPGGDAHRSGPAPHRSPASRPPWHPSRRTPRPDRGQGAR